jgi:hypothetical protein
MTLIKRIFTDLQRKENGPERLSESDEGELMGQTKTLPQITLIKRQTYHGGTETRRTAKAAESERQHLTADDTDQTDCH